MPQEGIFSSHLAHRNIWFSEIQRIELPVHLPPKNVNNYRIWLQNFTARNRFRDSTKSSHWKGPGDFQHDSLPPGSSSSLQYNSVQDPLNCNQARQQKKLWRKYTPKVQQRFYKRHKQQLLIKVSTTYQVYKSSPFMTRTPALTLPCSAHRDCISVALHYLPQGVWLPNQGHTQQSNLLWSKWNRSWDFQNREANSI